jgi:hypothetical protein
MNLKDFIWLFWKLFAQQGEHRRAAAVCFNDRL